jgi:hypothetical protein
MSDAVKPLMKSKTSSSGTHPKVIGTAKPADEEFHAFFAQGDSGDYDSEGVQAPTSMDPVSYDQSQVNSGKGAEVRRAFLAKFVGAVMGGCLVLLLVAVGVKSIKDRGAEHGRLQSAAAPQNRAAQLEHVVSATRSAGADVAVAAALQQALVASIGASARGVDEVMRHPEAETRAGTNTGAASQVAKNSKPSQPQSTPVQPEVRVAIEQGSRLTVRRSASNPKHHARRSAQRSETGSNTANTLKPRPSVAAFPVD